MLGTAGGLSGCPKMPILVAGSPNSDVAGFELTGFNVIKDVYLPSATPQTVAVENISYLYAFDLESSSALTFSAMNLPAWLTLIP